MTLHTFRTSKSVTAGARIGLTLLLHYVAKIVITMSSYDFSVLFPASQYTLIHSTTPLSSWILGIPGFLFSYSDRLLSVLCMIQPTQAHPLLIVLNAFNICLFPNSYKRPYNTKP